MPSKASRVTRLRRGPDNSSSRNLGPNAPESRNIHIIIDTYLILGPNKIKH